MLAAQAKRRNAQCSIPGLKNLETGADGGIDNGAPELDRAWLHGG